MRFKILSLLLFLSLGLTSFFHPIHLSVSEVNFNQESKSIEISSKVFIDDLEDGIVNIGGPQLHLFTENEVEDSDQWIKKYFDKNIKIKINDKDVAFSWVGRETDQKRDIQAVWVYLEVSGIRKVKNMELENTLLYDVHEDQRNMLHLKCNDTKKSWLFDLKKSIETIQW
ncbi:hypothetical protein KMW28_16150 [Flammeovirga yaeyamensis]|uniref:Uncharacterized protein n=1 Tax=Flammeovirga yaeyamensis TaxID=367791 RepID=A0AAX1N5Q9_9BACT|nr:DUF6702 family protein [Flammeovirga yaeyamensis]MBB3698458.1 hypothetical protein [Flammeovirga yaeyamensis]NMF34193.1 hypothetical protein [Flammeovirga yaeyamensis]QWG01178.1 hypothetical protein KMW28_16150 [Flammeovirga yaeyamensis]